MPTVSQIKQYLTLTVLPVAAGILATFLTTKVHFLAEFHITKSNLAGELTQLGTFGIGAGLAWLSQHHILKGSYKPPVMLESTLLSTAGPADLKLDAEDAVRDAIAAQGLGSLAAEIKADTARAVPGFVRAELLAQAQEAVAARLQDTPAPVPAQPLTTLEQVVDATTAAPVPPAA